MGWMGGLYAGRFRFFTPVAEEVATQVTPATPRRVGGYLVLHPRVDPVPVFIISPVGTQGDFFVALRCDFQGHSRTRAGVGPG